MSITCHFLRLGKNMSFISSKLCHKALSLLSLSKSLQSPVNLQIRNYAARKGYRAKRDKNKVKKVEEKIPFLQRQLNERRRLMASRPSLKFDDSKKGLPCDDVFCTMFYRSVVYPFKEAVDCFRQSHHPAMYNKPYEELHVRIELNMQGEKQTRFVDDFTRIAAIPHKFDHNQQRNLIVFSKSEEDLEKAKEAGAHLSGGIDIIKQIQNGNISLQDFNYYLASPNILPELVQLRGLMKRKFPNPKNGTLSADIEEMVYKYLNGISYTAKKDEFENDFGLIETVIGTIDMETKHLEENFASLVKDVYEMKPKREGSFITRCLLWSPPSPVKAKVDENLYIERKQSNDDASDNEDDNEANVAL